VICAGDDDGDEPMFDAVPDAVSIRVGADAGTSSRYSVSSPAELAVFLGVLAR
jgi:trehalose-6-phosphatase